MLTLHIRHGATGITADLESIVHRERNTVHVDIRDATMLLIDKVAVEKNMSVQKAMMNSTVEIFAKWEPS